MFADHPPFDVTGANRFRGRERAYPVKMTYEANIPRGKLKRIRSDDEIAEDAAEEILWYAQNDKQRIYEIVLRAIWTSKHPPKDD